MEAAANKRSRDSDDMENGTVVEPEIEKEEQDSEIDNDLRLLWEKMKVEESVRGLRKNRSASNPSKGE